MQILSQACGDYATNCYIIKSDKGDFIIDPGFNAFDFVQKNVQDPKAILNTHGHFDHVWDNAKLKDFYQIPIYIRKEDEFMLEDPFHMGHTPSKADILIEDENELEISGMKFKFHFFPGHTPGCCMIELVGENLMFSGDFLFKQSIGRWDFPYSDGKAMKQSLQKVLTYTKDYELLCGHGDKTSLKQEQANIPAWINYIG
ncbi:MBL fold metallo-hydrolase [Campylobacter sp. MIT 99-7217]|uniref:MBL fold metallo-hydrolase n=1 Tax=Campylobacter sp. MIT 99-7217 TaxID=535091 RepID=UPI00115C29A7|nr:MBL fold metallo-hydrolase [Campylobacter sp. MIT 99-7217]TQR34642.1 MBL fold metallo-hydrolase [Campylobacter sp. MIT 99-7217]